MARADSARGAAFGLGAAALFGLSAPLAKLLLPQTRPLMLAALLYLGGGVGLVLYGGARRVAGFEAVREARLKHADAPVLLLIIFFGGIAGPLLMLSGLQRLSGLLTSLLLNLEGPLTALLAVMAFGEHLSRRAVAASALVFGGALVLGAGGGEVSGDWVGVACVAGACACWALDNNLTAKLSLRDPPSVVRWKALGAGACMLAAALATGQRVAMGGVLVAALALGAASYGASILLALYAFRILGAAREAAYFATAPFIGAVAAVPLLGDRPSLAVGAAAVLMVFGVVLLVRDKQTLIHTHAPLEHEHVHVHDEHHQHEHEAGVIEPHSHAHRHGELTHEHPHASDAHHRHTHRR